MSDRSRENRNERSAYRSKRAAYRNDRAKIGANAPRSALSRNSSAWAPVFVLLRGAPTSVSSRPFSQQHPSAGEHHEPQRRRAPRDPNGARAAVGRGGGNHGRRSPPLRVHVARRGGS